MTDQIYNIPLRKEFRKGPKYKRASKAIRAIRKFLKRHVKLDVKLGKYLNEKVHEHGRKNVCHHVEVEIRKVKKKVDGKDVEILTAELVGAPVEKVEVSEEKGKLAKLKEKIIAPKEEKSKEEVEKDKVLKEKSKDEKKVLKSEKIKKGKLGTKVNIGEELKTRIPKDNKPSKETRLSKK